MKSTIRYFDENFKSKEDEDEGEVRQECGELLLVSTFCERDLVIPLESILVSLVIGEKHTHFALYCEKVLFSAEFHFKFWKSFAGTDKTQGRKIHHYQTEMNIG